MTKISTEGKGSRSTVGIDVLKDYFDKEEAPSMSEFFARYWSLIALEDDNIQTGQQLQKLWTDRFITVANEVSTMFSKDVDSEGWEKLVSLKTKLIAQDKAKNIANKQTIASLDYFDQSLEYTQQWLRDMQKRTSPLPEELHNHPQQQTSTQYDPEGIIDDEQPSGDQYFINSDTTVDHHSGRKDKYILKFDIHETSYDQATSSDQTSSDQTSWIVKPSINVTHHCQEFKKNCENIAKERRPQSLSDLRLLALNDIFLFSSTLEESVTKYIPWEDHAAIVNNLELCEEKPEIPSTAIMNCLEVSMVKSGKWYSVEESQCSSWFDIIAKCSSFMSDAIKAHDTFQIHVANALIKLAPKFINGFAPNSDIEDTFVHSYIAPLLESIFESEPLFRVNWANGTLSSDKKYKPDYVVYIKSVHINHDVVVGEFKAPNINSQIESDLVKLGKEMVAMYNQLVQKGAHDPYVCGILVQGYRLTTYRMDLASPRVYRLVHLTTCTMFKSLEEFTLIPQIISAIIQVKNYALITAHKIQAAMIRRTQLQPLSPSPPLEFLSYPTATLERDRKRKRSAEEEST